jgi:hypothetical protein
MVLYNKVLSRNSIPIVDVLIIIMSPIGPFVITINVDFFYGCDLRVGISNFRDVFI